MKQFKTIAMILIAFASFNANADALSGFLDLSNLYGKTNAGRYFVGLTLDIQNAGVLDAIQTQSALPGDEPWSEPKVCLTEFYVEAGKASLILTDADQDETKTLNQNIRLYSSHYDETEKCSSVQEILSKQITFTAYIYMGSVALNRKAPFDYEKLESSFSVFPYGYSVKLNFEQVAKGRFAATDLKLQLSNQIKRGNKEALSYYVFATKEQTTLSLGQGFLELK